MSSQECRPASEAVLSVLTESQFAQLRREEGAKIISHRGRHWQEAKRGFYTTVHLMARLTPDQATSPASFSWGYRTTLADADAPARNATIPVHILTDFDRFDMEKMPAKRRSDLRRCFTQVRIVELTGPALLREQGWEVAASSLQRVKAGSVPTREQYRASLGEVVTPGRRLVLAGLVGSHLAGYIVSHAVDGVAYLMSAYYATEMLATNVSTGLLYEWVQACRRCPGIRELVHGLHSIENPGLASYKEKLGFAIHNVPARVEINPLVARLLRWRRPDSYYRLTGQTPPRTKEADAQLTN